MIIQYYTGLQLIDGSFSHNAVKFNGYMMTLRNMKSPGTSKEKILSERKV
uniref:Uncharacterized protein n=1 Tax=Rhizophagus irregularis (strain DAOM 181602 / DAOM 197198 / MUCL 43194) TaxID=747089 RepID=U9T4G2_RHIID